MGATRDFFQRSPSSAPPLAAVPSKSAGYYSWCFAFAVLAAATCRILGFAATGLIVIALNLLFRLTRHLREDPNLAVPGAFFITFWGIPEVRLVEFL
jgi:hypothetical protein